MPNTHHSTNSNVHLAALEAPKVYLVDDDAAIRDALSLLLSLRGFDSIAFASGEEALEALSPSSRGCVLSDLRMPGVSGLELMEQAQSRGISLPIVMLTAHGDVATTRAALQGGAFDFLEKPIDDEILIDVLKHAIAEDARGHIQRIETGRQLARLETVVDDRLRRASFATRIDAARGRHLGVGRQRGISHGFDRLDLHRVLVER